MSEKTPTEDRWVIEATMQGSNLLPPRVDEKGLTLFIQQPFTLRGHEVAWIDLGLKLSAITDVRSEAFAAVTPGLVVQPDVFLPGDSLRVAVINVTEFVQQVPRGMGLVIARPHGWPWLKHKTVDVKVRVA